MWEQLGRARGPATKGCGDFLGTVQCMLSHGPFYRPGKKQFLSDPWGSGSLGACTSSCGSGPRNSCFPASDSGTWLPPVSSVLHVDVNKGGLCLLRNYLQEEFKH